ncbi:hypothetical protein, partial [Escherichia coli]|uniref:hypothetical protein n=1 Tax=Escherichia coli TaxID=562 RepID=UPI001BAED19A
KKKKTQPTKKVIELKEITGKRVKNKKKKNKSHKQRDCLKGPNINRKGGDCLTWANGRPFYIIRRTC